MGQYSTTQRDCQEKGRGKFPAPLKFILATATAAVIVVTAAAEQDDNQDDNPQTTIVTAKSVTEAAHLCHLLSV